MALPTGPITRPAFDEVIEEAFGDSVAQSLNNITQLTDQILWNPPGGFTDDAETAGTMSLWFPVGGATPSTITVPDWASKVFVRFELNGVHFVGANCTYKLQGQIGPTVGRSVRFTGQAGWFQCAWSDSINVSSLEGDRTVKINAQRVDPTSGTMHWQIDDQADIAVWMIFGTPVHEYTD
jgi:hypothetical protein